MNFNQLKSDLDPKDGIAIAKDVNKKLTDPLREKIAELHEHAVNFATTVLTRCTTDQLAEVINQSQGTFFYSVERREIDLTIDAIRFNHRGLWELDFDSVSNIEQETYVLSDLGLDDLLNLVDIVEYVLLN